MFAPKRTQKDHMPLWLSHLAIHAVGIDTKKGWRKIGRVTFLLYALQPVAWPSDLDTMTGRDFPSSTGALARAVHRSCPSEGCGFATRALGGKT